MARAFTGSTTGATPINLDITNGPAWEVYVKNTDATQTLNVNIPAVHGTEYYLIGAGESVFFSATLDAAHSTDIGELNVKDGNGAADYFVAVNKGRYVA